MVSTNLFHARSTDGGQLLGSVRVNANDGEVGFGQRRGSPGRNSTIHVLPGQRCFSLVTGKPVCGRAVHALDRWAAVASCSPQRLKHRRDRRCLFVHGGLSHAHVFGTLAVDAKGSCTRCGSTRATWRRTATRARSSYGVAQRRPQLLARSRAVPGRRPSLLPADCACRSPRSDCGSGRASRASSATASRHRLDRRWPHRSFAAPARREQALGDRGLPAEADDRHRGAKWQRRGDVLQRR